MNDGFEDIRIAAQKKADLEQKTKDANTKREKAQQSGNSKDFQDAVLADLNAIKAKLGM